MAQSPSPRPDCTGDAAAPGWPSIGLGTWRLGESRARRAADVSAIRSAIELGYRLIDTAEMYGEGGAEAAVGEALAGAIAERAVSQDAVTVVSKVYPHNASASNMRRACEASLKRLRVDRIDLYLLHWRGDTPLRETVDAFEDLARRGLIARWGVSNFDVADLRDLAEVPGGAACAANQVYLSIRERGPEFELLPLQQARRMPLMAYSPLDQGDLTGHQALRRCAERHSTTPAQIALAALLALDGVIVIPKASSPAHQRDNLAAARIRLTPEDRAELDRAFPPPRTKQPLSLR